MLIGIIGAGVLEMSLFVPGQVLKGFLLKNNKGDKTGPCVTISGLMTWC